MKKLTIEQRDEIYNFVMLDWNMNDDAGGILMRFLDTNTESIQAKSKSEYRRLKIQGANVKEPE